MMRLALAQALLFAMLSWPWVVQRGQRTMHTVISHGRRLLLHSPYILPKNASESERLDAQHHLVGLAFGAQVLAPVTQPRTMLDVGCGTGLWCREMAARFPAARIVGIDYNLDPLHAILAKLPESERPANVCWRAVDALSPWPLLDQSADYIHLRFAATWIPKDQWRPVLAEARRVLKPGGYLELLEGGMPASQSAAYTALCETLGTLLHGRGLSARVADYLEDVLAMAGLEAIESRAISTGATPAQQHLLFETTRQGFAALLPLLSHTLSAEDYAAYHTHLAEIEREQPHVTRRDCAAWGRKPL